MTYLFLLLADDPEGEGKTRASGSPILHSYSIQPQGSPGLSGGERHALVYTGGELFDPKPRPFLLSAVAAL